MHLLSFALLAPSLVTAFITANRTAVPGMTVVRMDDENNGTTLLTERDTAPSNYVFKWGYDDDCDGVWKITTHGNAEQPCQEFDFGPPQKIQWSNPPNPNSDTGLPYWNFILYFHGDSCPVVGHPIQCDTVGTFCLTFSDARPLSFNVVKAATGVRNCDV